MKKYFIFLMFVFLLAMFVTSVAAYTEPGLVTNYHSCVKVFNVPNTADDTTTVSMGIDNTLIENDFNIFFNPGEMFKYGTAYGEIWDSTSLSTRAWGGATAKVSIFKIAAFLGRPYAGNASQYLTFVQPQTGQLQNLINAYKGFDKSIVNINGAPPAFSGEALYAFDILIPQNHIDLLLGTKLGSMGVGLKLTYANNTDYRDYDIENEPAAIAGDGTIKKERASADHHITLGGLLMDLGPIKALGISFDIGMLSFKNTYEEDETVVGQSAKLTLESDNSPSIGVLVRPIMEFSFGRLIVPVYFNMIDTSAKGTRKIDGDGDGIFTNIQAPVGDRDDSFSITDKTTKFGILTALHTKPADNLKLIYSFGFTMESRKMTAEGVTNLTGTAEINQEIKDNSSTVNIPLGVSLEHDTLAWLKTRFGVQKLLIVSDSEEIEVKTTVGAANIGNNKKVMIDTLRDNANELVVSFGLGVKASSRMDMDMALAAGVNDIYSFTSLIARASLRYYY